MEGVLVNFYLFNTSEMETQTQKLRGKLYCESFVMGVNRPVSPASVAAWGEGKSGIKWWFWSCSDIGSQRWGSGLVGQNSDPLACLDDPLQCLLLLVVVPSVPRHDAVRPDPFKEHIFSRWSYYCASICYRTTWRLQMLSLEQTPLW